MKTLVGLSIVLIIGLQISGTHCKKLSIKELSQMIERMGQAKCLKKTGAQLEQLVAARSGQFDEDDQLKCYYKCIMEKMKMMKDDRYQVEVTDQQIRLMLEEPLHEKLISTGHICYETIPQTEPCEFAYEYVKCCYIRNPTQFMF